MNQTYIKGLAATIAYTNTKKPQRGQTIVHILEKTAIGNIGHQITFKEYIPNRFEGSHITYMRRQQQNSEYKIMRFKNSEEEARFGYRTFKPIYKNYK